MWFRHLRPYQLQQPITPVAEELQQALEQYQFQPCSATQKISIGFVPPLPEGSALYYRAGHSILITVRIQERLLPSAVVKDEVEERRQVIEAETGQPISAREKRALKNMVEEELLPKAFCRSRRIAAFWNDEHNLLVVDTTVASRAEAILGLLRQALGSLPVKPWPFTSSPAKAMTRWWQQGSMPDAWTLGDEIEGIDSTDVQRKWRYKGFAENDPLLAHLFDDNILVQKTKLTWRDALTLVATSDGMLTRLQWPDSIKEEGKADDPTEAAAHTFAVMQHQLCALWHDFVSLIEHG